MRLDEIKLAVPASVAAEIEDLFARYAQERGAEDVEGFAAWLHERDLIGGETFRNLHTLGSVVLTSMGSLGTYGEEPETTGDDASDSGSGERPRPSPAPRGSLPAVPTSWTFLTDRFEFLGKLAEGAMGEVHIARDRDLMRKVAIKRMHAKIVDKPQLASRFFVEAQVTAQLDHPNIVPVYGLERGEGGRLAYAMKLIKGRTFRDVCEQARRHHDRREPLPEDLVLSSRIDWFLRVCDAIAYAHSRGVVHRDLKPENVMVGTFGEVYVMDWGVARVLVDPSATLSGVRRIEVSTQNVRKTQLGAIIGTPAYMSPEQAEGLNDELDGRSDEFALGLILFELVTLRQAIKLGSTMQVLMRVQAAELEPIAHYAGEEVPRALRAIIAKACARAPDDRYPGVKAFADDLRRFVRDEEVLAAPDTRLQRLGRWAYHHQRTVALASALLLATVGTGAISSLAWDMNDIQAASVREQRLGDLLTAAGAQAHVIDADLLRYEGDLESLVAGVVEVLARDAATLGPAADDLFLDRQFAPPDLAPSPKYDRRISIGWPVLRLAASAEGPLPGLDSLRRLNLLRGPLKRLMLESHSEGAVGSSLGEELRVLLDEGAPLAWANVALADGASLTYPGHPELPQGYDARNEPWYRRAQESRGPRWGDPQFDLGGLGLMLPCSMAIYDSAGNFQGVAGIEIRLDDLIDEMLDSGTGNAIGGFEEAFLVTEDGRIVVRSGERGRGSVATFGTGRTVSLKPFPNLQVRRALADRTAGHLLVRDQNESRLYVHYRMDSVGWHYVLSGSARDLL